MATAVPGPRFNRIQDPQRPVTFVLGGVLLAIGIAGLSGLLGIELAVVTVVAAVFGVPFWLGLTMIVAGLLGVILAMHGDSASTFNKVTAGLVFPATLLLAITDWAVGAGTAWAIGVGLLALAAALLVIALGTILLWGHPLSLVFPLAAVLAVLDWTGSIAAAVPAASVTGPTIGLIVTLAIGVGLVGFADYRNGQTRSTP